MMFKEREIWFDGRRIPPEREDLWSLIHNSPLTKVVVTPEQYRAIHFPAKTEQILAVNDPSDWTQLPPGGIICSDRADLLTLARANGFRTCFATSIVGGAALEEASSTAPDFDYVIVDFDLPTNIPLELLIARLQNGRTVLLKKVSTVGEMEIAFGVMEEGSDGALLATEDPLEIFRLNAFLNRTAIRNIELIPLTVTEVRHVGMGIRACVDTTGLMTQEEGMLIGSTSGGGIFVCSETHYLPYMNLRPFRVNAGAIHSYIWTPRGNTAYLSELAAGSSVLCVNHRGEARELTVGRVKIEVRPLLLIQGKAADTEMNVIVQDDWHIRLMAADGSPRNATEIRPGDQLLSYPCPSGRHVGIKVDETIIER